MKGTPPGDAPQCVLAAALGIFVLTAGQESPPQARLQHMQIRPRYPTLLSRNTLPKSSRAVRSSNLMKQTGKAIKFFS